MYIWVIYNFYEDAEVSNFEEDAEVSNAGVPCLWVFFVSITSSLLGGGDAWSNVGAHGHSYQTRSKCQQNLRIDLAESHPVRLNQQDQLSWLSVM
jgi:hypothetical protein